MSNSLLLLITLACGAEPAAAAEKLTPGDHERTLTHDKLERSYLVHIPPQYDAAKPTPVVLAYHGGGTNSQTMVRFAGLNDKADEAGFIVVYPNGTGRLSMVLTFNAGNCCGSSVIDNVDDVGFTRALLDDLATVCNVDPKRVFATGISNGGMMAYRLASELSDRIAAIAPVGGPMGTKECKPKRPVSVMHFHGTEDKFAPFKGGQGDKSITRTMFYSVQHSMDRWVTADGCPKKPVVTKEPDSTDDGTRVIRHTYGPGKEGSEVVLVEIVGGGHTWPGHVPGGRLGERLVGPALKNFLGPTTTDISANDMMWEFFERHPMK